MTSDSDRERSNYDPDLIDLGNKTLVGKFVTASADGTKRAASSFLPLLLQFQATLYPVLRCGLVGFPRSGKSKFVEGLLANVPRNEEKISFYIERKNSPSLLVRNYDAASRARYGDYCNPQYLQEKFERQSDPRIDIVEHPQYDYSKNKDIHILWKFREVCGTHKAIECYAEPDLAASAEMKTVFPIIDDIIKEP